MPRRSVFCGGLGFEEEDFGAFDPAFAEIHAAPAVGVLFVDAAAAAEAEFFEVVLGPGFAHVGRPDDTTFVSGGGGADKNATVVAADDGSGIVGGAKPMRGGAH